MNAAARARVGEGSIVCRYRLRLAIRLAIARALAVKREGASRPARPLGTSRLARPRRCGQGYSPQLPPLGQPPSPSVSHSKVSVPALFSTENVFSLEGASETMVYWSTVGTPPSPGPVISSVALLSVG